jgi:hypothetical protein
MDAKAPDYIPVWQCIGCGRIEMPQTCIGVCRDRKVFLIGRETHEQALQQIARLEGLLSSTRARLLRFARCTPRAGDTDKTFAALQQQLRTLIAELPASAAEAAAA